MHPSTLFTNGIRKHLRFMLEGGSKDVEIERWEVIGKAWEKSRTEVTGMAWEKSRREVTGKAWENSRREVTE